MHVCNLMEGKRYEYIDIAKGVVIILMVLGHSSLPWYPQRWIFSFHMPFFFLISGLMTNWEKNGIREFVSKKVSTLLIPFVIYSLIVLLLTPLYSDKTIGTHSWQIMTKGWEGMALWFVPVLFFSQVVCYYILRWSLLNKYVALIAMMLVTYLYRDHVELPWTLYCIPYASSFVIIGALLKSALLTFQNASQGKAFSILTGCVILSLIAPLVSAVDMSCNKVYNFIPAYIGAIAGSFAVLLACMRFEKWKITTIWLQKCGQNTFVVVAFSQIIIMIINYNQILSPQYSFLKYVILVVALVAIAQMKKHVLKSYKEFRGGMI
mgnify:FL=1